MPERKRAAKTKSGRATRKKLAVRKEVVKDLEPTRGDEVRGGITHVAACASSRWYGLSKTGGCSGVLSG